MSLGSSFHIRNILSNELIPIFNGIFTFSVILDVSLICQLPFLVLGTVKTRTPLTLKTAEIYFYGRYLNKESTFLKAGRKHFIATAHFDFVIGFACAMLLSTQMNSAAKDPLSHISR